MAPSFVLRSTIGVLSATVVLAGCSAESQAPATTLRVHAAASLHEVFAELAREFERNHPGARVVTTFAGSADLVEQVRQGAPADVVATADRRSMARLQTARLLTGKPMPFATNTLQLAVPVANPARINRFGDLARPGVRLVICAEQVPCGAAARAVARADGISLHPVSEEQSVTDVLGKVRSGEADAGLVYVTDVRGAAGKVRGIDLPNARSAATQYQLGVVHPSTQASDFMALVTGPSGRRQLERAGFGGP